jgi:tagatose 6-phosphate kinase
LQHERPFITIKKYYIDPTKSLDLDNPKGNEINVWFSKPTREVHMILCLCPNPSVDMYVWLDGIQQGGVNRIKKEQRFPGGKGVHVALAVAELGEAVGLLGFWGGATGAWIKSACEEKGVLCYGPELADWSRTCMTFKSYNGLDETELLGAGPTIDADDLEQFVSDYETLLPQADAVTMSGSWPKGAPPDGYGQLLKIAHDDGVKTFLDTTGEQLIHALEEHPYVVHMNRVEVQEHFKETDIQKAAFLLAERCRYAVVTSGAEGVYIAEGREIHHAVCHVDEVYSAVGSGDCLLGGVAVALHRGMSVGDAARLGAACGAANCVREELGVFFRRDVELLLNEV